MVVSATVSARYNGILYIKFQGTNTVNGSIGTKPGWRLSLTACRLRRSKYERAAPATDLTKTVLIDLWQHEYRRLLHNESRSAGALLDSADYNYFILTNAAGQATSMAWGIDSLPGYGSFNVPAADTTSTTNTENANVDTNALRLSGHPTAVPTILTIEVQIQA